MFSLWGRIMLTLFYSCATGVVLGQKSEDILPTKIVRRFLVFGALWILTDFVRTHTTHKCDSPVATDVMVSPNVQWS